MECVITGLETESKSHDKKYSRNSTFKACKIDDVTNMTSADDVTVNGSTQSASCSVVPFSKKEKKMRHRKSKRRRGCVGGENKGRKESNGGPRTGSTGKGRYKTELCRTFDESGECRYDKNI